MKTLKFEAYDKKTNRMRVVTDLGFLSTGDLISCDVLIDRNGNDEEGYDPITERRELDEFELHQFTGELDEKGEEIYKKLT